MTKGILILTHRIYGSMGALWRRLRRGRRPKRRPIHTIITNRVSGRPMTQAELLGASPRWLFDMDDAFKVTPTVYADDEVGDG